MTVMLSIAVMFYVLVVVLPTIIRGIALPSCDSPFFSPNETVHANSVNVYMYSTCDTTATTNHTRIYYSTDGTDPVVDVSRYLLSGASVLINTIGKTTISALTIADNYDASKVVKKTYEIIPMCSTPSIYPNGGTYSGSVIVNIQVYTYQLTYLLNHLLT
jgi:hypothetical protein